MIVPIVSRTAGAAPDLHEAHVPLDEAAREQTPPTEVFCCLVVEAIELARELAFAAGVERFWRAELHPGREFVCLDAGLEARVRVVCRKVRLVELPQQGEAIAVPG